MSIAQLKAGYKEIPKPVRVFIIKALGLLIGWSLLSHFIFEPYRVPHRWLTNTTANLSVDVLNAVYEKGFAGFTAATCAGITKDGKLQLYILDGCNAFSLFVLYIGVLICIPTTIKRLLAFSVVGVLVIFLLNIVRCAGLIWLHINHPELMNFAHHYAFTIIVYLVIFGGWVLYAKNIGTAKQK